MGEFQAPYQFRGDTWLLYFRTPLSRGEVFQEKSRSRRFWFRKTVRRFNGTRSQGRLLGGWLRYIGKDIGTGKY